jgi:hypothetical protein
MKKLGFIVLFSWLLSSCQKVVTLGLNQAAPQLGIQGIISDTAGPYHVLIYKSVGFYSSNVYPNVSGASVSITDVTAGITDSLTETIAGDYITHVIAGTPGNTYQLKVIVNGATYASSSTMPQPVMLDSVTFDNQTKNTIRAVAHFQDPAGVVNFYKYSTTVNGVVLDRFQTFEDRLSDGRYITDKLDNDSSEIKNNDLVRVSLVGIDANVYTFLSEAEKVAYQNDQLAAPATPTSNITGGCLGYFSAQTVSSKDGWVKY